MKKILQLLITLFCLVIVLPAIAQKKQIPMPDNPLSLHELKNAHPRILVNDGDKQIILSKIENQKWARKLYDNLLEKIEPLAEVSGRAITGSISFFCLR